MKIKSAALFLMIGSIAWLASQVYFLYVRFSNSFGGQNIISIIFSIALLLLPLALLLFASAVYNKKIKPISDEPAEETASTDIVEYGASNMTVNGWIGTFVITAIPLVGIIFLIIWAMDHDKPVRRNWAIAALITSSFAIVLLIIFYAATPARRYY